MPPIFRSERRRPSTTSGSATGPAAGFFYIPGTDTCLQIGGLVRAEYAFISDALLLPAGHCGTKAPPHRRRHDHPGRNRDISGLLRPRPYRRRRPHADRLWHSAHLRALPDRSHPGQYGSGTAGGGNLRQPGRNNAYLDKGFIQFAGITAGRVQSFFDSTPTITTTKASPIRSEHQHPRLHLLGQRWRHRHAGA